MLFLNASANLNWFWEFWEWVASLSNIKLFDELKHVQFLEGDIFCCPESSVWFLAAALVNRFIFQATSVIPPLTRLLFTGRGSDSESDGAPHRKMPDVRKDDMSARRTSVSEPRTAMPFNQYLPNKSNQSGYVPTPLRKKKNDKEEGGRKSWSTATSPIGGDRPLRWVWQWLREMKCCHTEDAALTWQRLDILMSPNENWSSVFIIWEKGFKFKVCATELKSVNSWCWKMFIY